MIPWRRCRRSPRAGQRRPILGVGSLGNPAIPAVSAGSTTRADVSSARLRPEAAQALVDLALHAEDERVRSICLVAVLDRSGVRPIDYDPAQDVTPPSWDPGALTDEEREDLKALLVKMIGKGKP